MSKKVLQEKCMSKSLFSTSSSMGNQNYQVFYDDDYEIEDAEKS
jgi:hypothetical protein